MTTKVMIITTRPALTVPFFEDQLDGALAAMNLAARPVRGEDGFIKGKLMSSHDGLTKVLESYWDSRDARTAFRAKLPEALTSARNAYNEAHGIKVQLVTSDE